MSFLPLRSKYDQLGLLSLPTVTTQAVTNITSTSADGNGTLINAGGSAITARGFVFTFIYPQPTIIDGISTIVVEGGTSTGAFTKTLSASLSSSLTYYVRAYATNAIGTGYGDTVVFTTSAATANIASRQLLGMGM